MTARPEVAVGAVVVDADDLLLVRRRNPPAAGTWSLPGGRVERGEALAEAVVRELAEETGMEGVCGELVGWSELIDEHHHTLILDFWAHLLARTEPVADTDAVDARWVPLGDVAEMALAPGLAEFLYDHEVIATFT